MAPGAAGDGVSGPSGRSSPIGARAAHRLSRSVRPPDGRGSVPQGWRTQAIDLRRPARVASRCLEISSFVAGDRDVRTAGIGCARADRPVPHPAAAGHGRDGRSLGSGADRADPPSRGAEDHQAGDGHAPGDRSLRRGASGPGVDGSSGHREGVRCGCHGGGPSVLRDGTGAGPAAARVLRHAQAHDRGPAAALRPDVQRGAARASEGHHSP